MERLAAQSCTALQSGSLESRAEKHEQPQKTPQDEENLSPKKGPTLRTRFWGWFRQQSSDEPWGPLILETVNEYPHGYPRFAARLSADVNLQLSRRFGYLHNRILLHYQDTLAELEEGLRRIDNAESDKFRLNSRRYDEGPKGNPIRIGLLNQIKSTLKEYDEFILRQSQILKLESPKRQSLRNLLTWMWNEKPLCKVEHETVYRKDDLLTLSSDDDTWTITLFESLITVLPWRVQRYLFPSPDKNEHAIAWSDKRMAVVIKSLLALFAVIFLILPVFLLLNIRTNQSIKATIVALFALGFAMVTSLLTKAKRHEIFVATATYCAVLVVFLSSLPPAA